MFDVGRAGQSFYVRAYTGQEEEQGAAWELQLVSIDAYESTVVLEGQMSLVGVEPPRVLPLSLDVTRTRTYRIIVRP